MSGRPRPPRDRTGRPVATGPARPGTPGAGRGASNRNAPNRNAPNRAAPGRTEPGRPDDDPTDRRHPAALGADLREEADLDALERLGDPPAAHPARSRPQDARDGEVLMLPDAGDGEDDGDAEEHETPVPAGAARRPQPQRKQRRASVPSWDDIVFGQRRD